jgi:hypothetical protein
LTPEGARGSIRDYKLTFFQNVKTGNTNYGGRLGTVDFRIQVACFVIKVNNIFDIKGDDLN